MRASFSAPCLLAIGLCLLGAVVSPAVAAPRSVVILAAESPELVGSVIIRQSVISALRAGGSEPLDIYEETIDTTRFASSNYDASLAALYRAKYASRPPSLVIALAKPALEFLLRHQGEVFPDVPVLFGFMDERDVRELSLRPNMTGVFVQLETRATIETALHLHPGTRHVVVVGGVSPFDRAWMNVVRQDLRPLESSVSVTYMPDTPFQKVLADVAALRDQTLLLFVSMTLDGDGRPRMPTDVVTLLRGVAQVPIYGIASSYLGRGIVGGFTLDFRLHGTDVGRRARQILDGAQPASLPLLRTPSMTGFDARELKRFGISESRLPAGATVVNRQPRLWDLYRNYVIGALAVFLIQSSFMAGLLIQGAKRRRAEQALRTNFEALQASQEDGRRLAGRLIAAQEVERSRIGRELHDDLSQKVALLAMDIHRVSAGVPPGMLGHVSVMADRAAEIGTELHNLSHELHPAKLQMLGLVKATQILCRDLAVRHTLTIDFVPDRVPPAVPSDQALCLYRIAQEALQNVVKHSGARNAVVTLTGRPGSLELEVADSGDGFDLAAEGAGIGLLSMRERVNFLGGQITIGSKPGSGTRIVVCVPVGESHAGKERDRAPSVDAFTRASAAPSRPAQGRA